MIKRNHILEIIEDNRRSLKRLGVKRIGIFGSFARNIPRKDSDVDVLVTFAEDSDLSLYDLVDMQEELRIIFGRDVNLVLKSGLRNPFRRHEILRTQQVIYAA